MITSKALANWFKKDPFIHSIFLFVSIILILIISVVGYFYLRFFGLDKYYEAVIDKRFHQEIATIPQIKVTKFMLWEGDSMADIDIQNKGTVSFWYSKDGVPSIEAIGQYNTSLKPVMLMIQL